MLGSFKGEGSLATEVFDLQTSHFVRKVMFRRKNLSDRASMCLVRYALYMGRDFT